jgi:hypothetical protein
MSNAKVLDFDGIGYVSNRGYSKYWGVSLDPNTNKEWRVCVTEGKTENVTYHLSAELRQSNEQFAAQLASHLYQFRGQYLPVIVDVEVNGKLYRFDKALKLIYETRTLVYGYFVESPKMPVSETESSFDENDISDMIDNLVKSELDCNLIHEVFFLLMNDETSEMSRKVLKKVVDVLA